MCFFWSRGWCRFGGACRFLHGGRRGDGGGGRASANGRGRGGNGRGPAAPPGGTPGERVWIEAPPPPTAAPPAHTFRLLTYNCLADGLAREHAPALYRCVPPAVLAWPARRAALLAELTLWAADVACLQEVDRPDELTALLGEAGYACAYAPRTGGRADGCLTAWRTERWELVGQATAVRMADHGLKDNVALLAVLRPVGTRAAGGGPAAAPLAIANTHLLFNPKRGDVKVAQARTLLEALAGLAEAAGAGHALVAGDFNATPGSAVYAFVAGGALDVGPLDRRRMSGQLAGVAGGGGWRGAPGAATAPVADGASTGAATTATTTTSGDVDTDDEFTGDGEGGGRGGGGPPPPAPAPTPPPRLINPAWTVDQLRATVGPGCAPPPPPAPPPPASAKQAGGRAAAPALPPPTRPGPASAAAASAPSAWVARHPLRLASAYAAATPDGSEPAFTSAHSGFVGTVDYIWFTPDALGRRSGGGGGGAAEAGGGEAARPPPTRLRPVRALAPPPLAALPAGLPTPAFGSDHISVVVDFAVEVG